MSLANFLEQVRTAGAQPEQEALLLRAWLSGREVAFHKKNPRQPAKKKLLEALPQAARELTSIASIRSAHPAQDGAIRLLVDLARGGSVESVWLTRGGLCVSTQLGCAVGCRFCKTGESGLLRQLAADEILAQVALGQSRGPLRRVVLMGMGEPAHNLPAVLEALSLLWRQGSFAHENLVVSSVGDERLFTALLAHEVHPTLALSLHTTYAEKRAELLPRAPRLSPKDLLERAADYCERVDLWGQIQWTLLEGVNDGDDEIERLIELVRDKPLMVNFIPFNAVDGNGYRRPSLERQIELVRALKRAGIFATLRRSGAQEVDGGCGQLRARAAWPAPVPELRQGRAPWPC